MVPADRPQSPNLRANSQCQTLRLRESHRTGLPHQGPGVGNCRPGVAQPGRAVAKNLSFLLCHPEDWRFSARRGISREPTLHSEPEAFIPDPAPKERNMKAPDGSPG